MINIEKLSGIANLIFVPRIQEKEVVEISTLALAAKLYVDV